MKNLRLIAKDLKGLVLIHAGDGHDIYSLRIFYFRVKFAGNTSGIESNHPGRVIYYLSNDILRGKTEDIINIIDLNLGLVKLKFTLSVLN